MHLCGKMGLCQKGKAVPAHCGSGLSIQIMIRLPTRCFLLSFSVFLIGLAACDKDKTTRVNGTVIDKVTRDPLSDALVEFRISHNEVAPPNNYEFQTVFTDVDGKFNFQSYDPFSIYQVMRQGYLPRGQGTLVVPLHTGLNDVIIEMIPRDGVLKLNLENSAGIHDTIYVAIYSALQESALGLSYGYILKTHYEIPSASSKEVTLGLASEENIDIYWSFTPWPTFSSIKLSPYHDSVYIIRSDTTSFNISF